ncbi:hypothetical protein L0663_05015 [Dyadobacter sp. CY107]|uniref:glycerophosphodiester phosphodiesterase family protein n=1 Tax=Dyadobacter fanqingshengii TaxID=2906443 RepID=UPI001F24FF38|nr:glycerophosphodiester phosphodiesterase family protein [Dyadobacter fanqingshengii]MCF2502727.1 hypothetical protein [Dyadobacter fanqingshengii]
MKTINKRLILVVIIFGLLLRPIFKELGIEIDQVLDEGIAYTIIGAIGTLLYEICKDVLKDDLAGYFDKKKNNDKEYNNLEITEGESIKNARKFLRNKIRERARNHITKINTGEFKYTNSLNWRVKTEDKKFDQKIGSLQEAKVKFEISETTSIVIIGHPGVGKTSAIYAYLNELTDRLVTDKVPVYFSLSLWVNDRPIREWMKTELNRNYGFNGLVYDYLIDRGHILPFFDGLDQIKNIDLRNKCFEQVSSLASQTAVLLSCRPTEFHAVEKNFEDLYNRTIKDDFKVLELQPLRSSQVFKVLDSVRGIEPISLLAKNNEKFLNFVSLPLTLSVVVTVKDAFSEDDIHYILKQKDISSIYERVWKRYDEYVFNPDKSTTNPKGILFADRTVRIWLHALAKNAGDIIFIDNIQPNLLDPQTKIFYFIFSRVVTSVALSIGIGFFLIGPFAYWQVGILAGLIAAFLSLKARQYILTSVSLFNRIYLNHKVATVALFYVANVVILGLYCGFITPRKPADLIGGHFAVTESYVGFFMALFFGTLFGMREYWHFNNKNAAEESSPKSSVGQKSIKDDIKPVENIEIDITQFLQFGIFGGTLMGVFVGLCGVFVVAFFPNGTFTDWIHTIDAAVAEYVIMPDNELLNIFLLGSFIGIAFGFPLIGCLGFLNQHKLSESSDRKKSLFTGNFGFKKSIKNTLKGAFLAGIIMVPTYSILFGVLTDDFTGTIKGIKSGIGGAILVGLWLGGFDVLQHFVLRFFIWSKGGPFKFEKFLTYCSGHRLVINQGASYEFIHPTLQVYFAQLKLEKEHKPIPSFVGWLLALAAVVIFAIPIVRRFEGNYFWRNSNGFAISILSSELKRIKLSKLIVLKSGLLRIRAYGAIAAGNFTGVVHPEGTRAGFLGMDIGNAYNISSGSKDRHAAVRVRKSLDKRWSLLENTMHPLNPFSERRLELYVSKGDTVEIQVNDKEYHNNYGKFDLRLSLRNKIDVIAHRGAAGLNPENTLLAIQNSINSGFKIIEIDVRQTSDGELVLMHDTDINRTTTGKGDVRKLSFSDIEGHFIRQSQDTLKVKVPRLLEALSLIKNYSGKVLLDIKEPLSYPTFIDSLITQINRAGVEAKVEVFSFDKDFLEKIKSRRPNIVTGLFVISPIDFKKVFGVNIVGVHFSTLYLFPGFIDHLHSMNYKVYAWTVNSESHLKYAIKSEIDGLISDYPNRAELYLNNLVPPLQIRHD